MTDQENLMEFSGCDENSPFCQGEITVLQKPGTPVIVHSILKASTRDNLIQLQTPVQKEPKRLKVHFETPSQHSASLYDETKEDLETEMESPAGMDAIRDLDEKENWIERNLILTKMDHDDYMKFSKEILLDVIADMPIRICDEKHKEVKKQGQNTEGRSEDSEIDGIASQLDTLNSQFKEKKLEHSQTETGTVSTKSEPSDTEKTEVLKTKPGAITTRIKKDSDMDLGEEHFVNGKRNDFSNFENEKEAENKQDKAVSSDEEFLSADEDLPVGENVKSPEPIPPKRLYDLDFDDLDWINTFATKDSAGKTTVGEAEGRKETSQDQKEHVVSEISNYSQTIELALEAADLFQPTHQIANSPVGDKKPIQVEVDREENQMSDSEEKSKNNQTESSLLPFNTPEKPMPDLFETKSKLAVSPSSGHKGTDEIDPIRSRKQLSNIPEDVTDEENPFATKSKMANSLDCSDNPIKTISNIANSPIVKETNVAENNIETSQTSDSPNKANKAEKEEIGPFKPIKQLKSFPDKSHENDLKNDSDPFRPRKQMINSPSISDRTEESHDANIDPFKPRKQLANSDKTELSDAIIDPYKLSKQLVNSFVISGDTELDPLKASKQLSNSLVASTDAELDPFKPSKKLANSPVFKDGSGNMEIYPSEFSTTNLEYFSASDFKISDSVSGVSGIEEPVINQQTAKQKTCSNPNEQGFKMVEEEEEEDDLTVHTVTKRSQMDFPTGELDFGLDSNTALDEAQFVPATEVFNDPSMLDMLEQFGRSENKTESTLSRISLYVKFDPLVKSEMGPTNPRRISIRPKQLEKVKEFGLEESFLLLGTPPKKWKKPILPRDPNVTPTGAVSNKRIKSVDMLFSISPEDQDQDNESGFGQPPCTPMLIADDDCQDGIIEVLKYTEVDWKKMKRQMTLEFQGHLLSKEKEWSQELEVNTKTSQKEIRDAQEKANKLQANIENLMMVLSEYEKMINTLIAEKEMVSSKSKENIEEIKKERDEMKKERDQALEDLRSLDKFISDFHRRYDKMKTALEGYVQNEAILKKTAEEYQQKFIKTEKKLAVTKHDADKLEHVTKELEKVMGAKESEVSRLEAALKMKDLQISKLEQSLEQKDKEVKEVTDICEKLLSGVAHHK